MGDDDYYIIPSSVDEVLIMPCSLGMAVDDIKQMIYSVNHESGTVAEEKILSDSLYLYRKGSLEVVA